MELGRVLTITTDSVAPQEHAQLVGLDAVMGHVQEREQAFLATLMNITGTSNLGWETISRDALGRTVKKPAPPGYPGAIFTGDNLCGLASFALYDSLLPLVPPQMPLDVVSFLSDFTAENWHFRDVTLEAFEHCVVRVGESDGQRVAYFDPTYAAAHHKEAGKIKVTTEEAFASTYRMSVKEGWSSFQSVVSEHDENLTEILNGIGILRSDYHRLIQTMR